MQKIWAICLITLLAREGRASFDCANFLEGLTGAREVFIGGVAHRIVDRDSFKYGSDGPVAAAWIGERARAWGYSPQFTHFGLRGKDGRAILTNCSVLIPPTSGANPLADETVIVCAHYDSRGPGADDNGSGVTALMKLLHGWRGRSFSRTVEVTAFDGEEYDLLGSRAYYANLPPRKKIHAVVNVDMVGRPDRPDILNIYSIEERRIELHVPHLEPVFSQAQDFLWSSDSRTFCRARLPCLSVSHLNRPRAQWPSYMHTGDDTVDNIDYEYLSRVTEAVRQLVESAASAESWATPPSPKPIVAQ